MMKKIGFMMKKKSGIRKEIKSPYFGDQKYDVQIGEKRCQIQKNQKSKKLKKYKKSAGPGLGGCAERKNSMEFQEMYGIP